MCTGCAACANRCEKKAISMQPDEKGFLRPQIDQSLCVDCGLCRKVCPQNERVAPSQEGKVYAALAVDDKLRAQSSSGGIFSLLAEKTIQNGGVVFGAAMGDDLHVRHVAVASKQDLARLRGSKYVQSEIGDCYRQAKESLEKGKEVLFSGTPCQIDGLKHFLGKSYDKLLTVDILCHGVPSPAVLQKFVESKESSTRKKVVGLNFRDKDPGWQGFSTTLFLDDGTKEIDNSYYYFFVGDYCLRDSCSNCLYASAHRIGDFTLGDFWGYRETGPEHIEDDDLGISLLFINNDKGNAALNAIRDKIDRAPRRIEETVKGNPLLSHPFPAHKRSAEFWNDFPSLSWDELVEKYGVSREKKKDRLSAEDRAYFAKPYKQRHFRHVIHCLKSDLLRKFGR